MLSRILPIFVSVSIRTSRRAIASGILRLPQTTSASTIRQLQFATPLRISSNIRLFSNDAISSVVVPSMGDSITEGTLIEWTKKVGDHVEADEVICVLETDKVTVDVRSSQSGILVEQLAAVDSVVNVGAVLAKISNLVQSKPSISAASTTSSPEKSQSSPQTEKTSATEAPKKGEEFIVNVPSMGDSISEGTVSSWVKKVGDYVQADETVCILETDKVSVDVRSPKAGILQAQLAEEGNIVAVGSPLIRLATTSAPPSKAETKQTAAPEKHHTPAPKKVEEPKKEAKQAPITQQTQQPKQEAQKKASITTQQHDRTETRVKMTRMRIRIAERLKQAQNINAMLTTFQECDMTKLIEMRKEYKDEFEKKHGVKLGFMSAFVKSASAALQEIPAINGYIDDEKKEIVYHNYADISVAVASPTGLVVPVLRNTEKMSFADVEKKIAEYGQKAKNGTLAIEDMAGGTFTISNGGVFGSLMGTPIINPPQSAILGMHATKMRPYVVNGQVVPRPMMYLALTYDHRLIDGREAVTFLKSLATKIENPERLILDL